VLHRAVDGTGGRAVRPEPVRAPDGELCLALLHRPNYDDPRRVRYRSPQPILQPAEAAETEGIVNNVVFPTGVDVRDPRTIDIYYGMADARIGAARLFLPAP
jgi:predicted GH43/DUF377 family glycosyl hydrolase